MPKLRTVALAGGVSLLFAGAAFAAAEKLHTMKVDLPDGSVAHITYAGDVAPKVAVEPGDARQMVAYDPFAAMDREMAVMEQRHAQIMQQVAEMQRAAASGQAAQPGQVLISGNLPTGSSYSYTMVSSANGKTACTQTVEYRSDGSSAEPKVTHASSGDCDAVKMNDKPVTVSAPKEAPVRHDPLSI
jgi:hypothetical protein